MRAAGWRKRWALALAVVVVAIDLVVIAADDSDHDPSEVAGVERAAPLAVAAPRDPTTTTSRPATTTTEAPTTTTTEAPRAKKKRKTPTTTPTRPDSGAATTARSTKDGAWTLAPYEGMGAWLDVYDWTDSLTGGHPEVHLADIDRMADLGIQTLYIQTAHRRSSAKVIDPDRLMPFINRAHAHGMDVVAWYLPTLEDVNVDLSRLVAAARLPVEGLAVDIESLAVADPALRTGRLRELSVRLRHAMRDRAVAAITPSAVHLQVVNPQFWPGFPWREIAEAYDAILPMSYWSVRRPEWNSGERYIGENIDRIRASTGQPDVPIHAIGGIADGATVADVQGMVRAIRARKILGGSLYDWNTSNRYQWKAMRKLRAG